MYEESLAIERELGNKHHIAALLEGFAVVALALSGAASAARIWGREERLREEIGVPLTPLHVSTTTARLLPPAPRWAMRQRST